MTSLESKVQELLDRDRNSKQFGLRVVEELTREEDDWVYIVVQPSQPGIQAYDYSELLGRVESEIRNSQSTNVLVVPASGDLN